MRSLLRIIDLLALVPALCASAQAGLHAGGAVAAEPSGLMEAGRSPDPFSTRWEGTMPRCEQLAPLLGLLVAALLGASGAAAQASIQAGVAAAVRGPVLLDRAPDIGIDVASGDAIRLGDVIRTGPDAGLQILLLDETVFTLGPDSELVIDEFVYDPGRQGGRIGVDLAKGVFRFVTGKVARDEPQNVEIKLPVGSIGIRGTIGGARVGDEQSLVALLGPGPLNDASERVGGLDVRGPGGHTELITPGFGVRIGADGAPGDAFSLGEAELRVLSLAGTRLPASGPRPRGLAEDRAGTPHGGDGPVPRSRGPNPVEQAAGVVRESGRRSSHAPVRVAREGVALDDLDPSALQTPDEESFELLVPETFDAPMFPDGRSTVGDLVQFAGLFQGSFVWEVLGAPINPPHPGTFDAKVEVDFGAKSIGFDFGNLASATYLTVGAGAPFQRTKPFAASEGPLADFVLSGLYVEPSACIPCTVTLNARFSNEGGKPAGKGDFFVVITDGSTVSLAGPFVGPPTLIKP